MMKKYREKSEKKFAMHRGSALLSVMIVTTVLAILLGGLFVYVSSTTRQTAIFVGTDVCRLAAQSEIEIAKNAIYQGFMRSPKMLGARKIVGGSVSGQSWDPFSWFQSYAGDTVARSIGANPVVTFDDTVETMGCRVRVGIARVERPLEESMALVTIVAQASRLNPGGSRSRATIIETVRFANQRSRVFDNAYFVNNYGWFQGSGIFANGDVRANGNMNLDSSATINGNVYAARNDELGVQGVVTGVGKMDNSATYRSKTYGSKDSARPLREDPTTGSINPGGYDAPATVTTETTRNRIHEKQLVGLEMPYIGDISSSESEYRAWAQELHDADSRMSTIRQGTETLVTVYHDKAGPSGVQTVIDESHPSRINVRAPDYGSIVLVGTAAKPIEINGPVIIPGDVIISGYVKGQGTIYAGRNIHIVGNIQYVNPPQWSNKSASSSVNAGKDMLGLMAKGNIVLGNCTSSEWMNSIKSYISSKPYVQPYACDTSDAAIGYPATFGGSYSVQEYVNATDFVTCRNAGLTDFIPGGYKESTGKFGKMKETYPTKAVKDRYGRTTYETDYTQQPMRTITYDRTYYDSVCAPREISTRATAEITRIDAVLYNNHGIFGKIGKCVINGSLVCRNEGIIHGGNLWLNWDWRLYSNSKDTVKNEVVGLAKSSDHVPETVLWMEVSNDFVHFASNDSEGEGD